MTLPSLALGTVQFGLPYGVAGRGEAVPEAEARAILQRAWSLGIRRLDTAPAYGSIEERLCGLIEDLPFSIVSKVAAVQAQADARATGSWVKASIETSRKRLGDRLGGILFHNSDDLLGARGEAAWAAAEEATEGKTGLGPSCYDAAALQEIEKRFAPTMAQLPGNALDQGLAKAPPSPSVEISLRSIFLQGLLLMPLEAASARVPAARPALEKWHRFCAEIGVPPLRAALSVAKGLPNVSFCLVGVESLGQLEQIAEEWDRAPPVTAPWLDTRDKDTIDPRRWNPSK